MTYYVDWSDKAEKKLSKLSKNAIIQVRKRLELAAEDPNHFVEAISSGELKIRAGFYRIFVDVDHASRIIKILSVDHRDNAYKP